MYSFRTCYHNLDGMRMDEYVCVCVCVCRKAFAQEAIRTNKETNKRKVTRINSAFSLSELCKKTLFALVNFNLLYILLALQTLVEAFCSCYSKKLASLLNDENICLII